MRLKTLSALIAIISVNAMADEFFLGGGYDFYRRTDTKIRGNDKLKRGFKIKAEWFPFEKDNFKMGLGLEYVSNLKPKVNGIKIKSGNAVPVYAVIKPEWKTDREWKFYNKYKFGWSFSSEGKHGASGKSDINRSFKSGLYAGIEAGAEWKNFSIGITYDVNNRKHQAGIVVGYVFNKERTHKPAIILPDRTEKRGKTEIQEIPVRITETMPSVIRVRNGKENINIPDESSDSDKSPDINKNLSNNGFGSGDFGNNKFNSNKNKKIGNMKTEDRKSESGYKGWFSFDEEINK